MEKRAGISAARICDQEPLMETGARGQHMPRLHRPIDDSALANYPLKRIVIELQAPASASVRDMLCDLDEIAARLRAGETAFAAEALFGYRVIVGEGGVDIFAAEQSSVTPDDPGLTN